MLHTIKARIASLEIKMAKEEEKERDTIRMTLAATGDYSVTEVESNPEKKTVWNVFVDNASNAKTRGALLCPTTEFISIDEKLKSLVQEIYFHQQVALFEVDIKKDQISIQKIILGGK